MFGSWFGRCKLSFILSQFSCMFGKIMFGLFVTISFNLKTIAWEKARYFCFSLQSHSILQNKNRTCEWLTISPFTINSVAALICAQMQAIYKKDSGLFWERICQNRAFTLLTKSREREGTKRICIEHKMHAIVRPIKIWVCDCVMTAPQGTSHKAHNSGVHLLLLDTNLRKSAHFPLLLIKLASFELF